MNEDHMWYEWGKNTLHPSPPKNRKLFQLSGTYPSWQPSSSSQSWTSWPSQTSGSCSIAHRRQSDTGTVSHSTELAICGTLWHTTKKSQTCTNAHVSFTVWAITLAHSTHSTCLMNAPLVWTANACHMYGNSSLKVGESNLSRGNFKMVIRRHAMMICDLQVIQCPGSRR